MAGNTFDRWQVGAARVTRLVELGSMVTPPAMLMEHATPERVRKYPWLCPDFADSDGNLIYSIQAFVIEAAGQRIVVDTCIGNDKKRAVEFLSDLQTPFLENFRQAGFDPESIDVVLCTHLHVDHVGWNTRLQDGKWLPTFPHARYLFSRLDWERVATPGHIEPIGDFLSDSLLPIVHASLCDLVETDHVVNEVVRLEPTPGHTSGHVSVLIASHGSSAVITGDMIHHPLQCAEPQLFTRFCEDPERSVETRQRFLQRCCGTDTLVIGSHFPAWTAGRIVAEGAGYRLARGEGLRERHELPSFGE